MKLLADECLEPEVVRLLRASGHDVVWMRDAASGTLDPGVAELAVQQKRIILTYDVAFASEMRRAEQSHPGFIVARLVGKPKHEIAFQFEQVLGKRQNWAGTIAVIKAKSVRFNP